MLKIEDLIKKYNTVSLEDEKENLTEDESLETDEPLEQGTEEETQELNGDDTVTEEVSETTEEPGDATYLEAPTDEQGEVTTTDEVTTVAEVEPEVDVVEAGDDVGQETPTEEIAPDDAADINSQNLTEDNNLEVVNNALTQAEAATKVDEEIIEQAAADISEGTPTDVNGNTITEEEAEVNEEEQKLDQEVDEAAEENADAVKEIIAPETSEEETESEEALDAINENVEEALDDNLDDLGSGDTDTTGDIGSDDTGSGTDLGESEEISDDTPLEDAEPTVTDNVEDTDIDTAITEQNEAAELTAETTDSVDSDSNTEEGADLDDDTPLEGVDDSSAMPTPETEEVPIEVDDKLTDKEVDGTPDGINGAQDDTAATVEESIDAADNPDETVAQDLADETEAQVEEVEQATSEAAGSEEEQESDVVEEEVADTGEDEDAVFDEGELDIDDVDDEVTDELVEEAEEVAEEEEAAADDDEEEAIDATQTIEELQKESEALEHYIVRLKNGIANEQYSPYLVADVNIKLSELQSQFGRHSPSVPSLEDYGSSDLDLLYKASLESANAFSTKLTSFANKLAGKLGDWWKRPMITAVYKRADAINKGLDNVITKVQKSKFDKGSVSVGSFLSTADASIIKSVGADLKASTNIATKGLRANEELLDKIGRMLKDLSAASKPETIETILKQVSSLEAPKGKYPAEAFNSGTLTAGYKLVVKEKGDIPTIDRHKASDRKASFELTKADVVNLLIMGKAYTALAKKTAEVIGEKAVNEVGKFMVKPQHSNVYVTPNVASKVTELEKRANTLSKQHKDMYVFIVKHCLEMAEALVGVGKKAS